MKVGNTVRVFDVGQTYSLYKDMYKSFGYELEDWRKDCANGDIGIIVGIRKHPDYNRHIACVRFLGGYSIIGVDGLNVLSDIKNPVQNYIYKQTRHTFAKPISNSGKETNYFKILKYIKVCGSCSRQEVVYNLFGKDLLRQRSWYCGVFAALRQAGLLNYDQANRVWYKGPKLEEYFKFANSQR